MSQPAETAPKNVPEFPVSIATPELAAWLAGNTGVPGFTTRDSGQPGPHVLLMSLMHGNEIAGAAVLADLLRDNFWPARGRLTFGFANIAAFARFDPKTPLTARYAEEDMNRLWDDAQIFGVRRSAELDRVREIRPLVEQADVVLDLHSMLWPSEPLLLCGSAARGKALALALGTPARVVADPGHTGGKRLIDYARFCGPGEATAILLEAGQHWEPAALAQTHATVFSLLRHTGLAEGGPAPEPARHFSQVTAAITARTNRFVFLRDFFGGEVVPAAGTLIAHDGDEEIRTPYDDCMLVMPSLRVSLGHTAVRFARLEE